MKIGNFLVPEMRLEDLLVSTLSKIYGMSKIDPIQSKTLSDSLGYKYGTEPTFFKKINSMLAYGILEGRGIYNVTKLGVDLLHPENPEMDKRLKTKAIMNVGLWKALYEKHKKNPPKEGLWVSIKNIADVEPEIAKEYENRIYSWYMQDIVLVSEQYLEQQPTDDDHNTTLSDDSKSISTSNKTIPQPKDIINPDVIQKFEIGKSIVYLPKDEIVKEWQKIKKMIDIYLEIPENTN